MVHNVLLKQIDDWRDISLPKELVKRPRLRMLGANSSVTGFGNEYKTSNINDTNTHPRRVCQDSCFICVQFQV